MPRMQMEKMEPFRKKESGQSVQKLNELVELMKSDNFLDDLKDLETVLYGEDGQTISLENHKRIQSEKPQLKQKVLELMEKRIRTMNEFAESLKKTI
jgi:hypothetical protein